MTRTGLIVLSLLIAGQGYGQVRLYPPPQRIFSVATWEGRERALGEALQHFPLSDSAMQKAAAQLLYREENDPEWAENDERESFEHYEEVLLELNKRIALTYNNPMAWHALVWANYNPESDFGDWLRHQPQAVKLILKMSEDPREIPQTSAAEMLAMLMEECSTKPEIATCSVVEPRRERIVFVIHQRILTFPDQKKGAPIEALGYCGSQTDLPLLQQLIDQQRARSIRSEDVTTFTVKQTIIGLSIRAQDKIRQRLAITNQPPK